MNNSQKDYFVFDNLIDPNEILWLYDAILSEKGWNINCHPGKGKNSAFNTHPVFSIIKEHNIDSYFWAGYIKSLLFRINNINKKENNFDLPLNIKRCHIIAKSSLSSSETHIDSKDINDWSVIIFLNPIWDSNDGGQFIIENEEFECKPGRIIIFKSNLFHDGGKILNNKINYWRVLLNMILTFK